MPHQLWLNYPVLGLGVWPTEETDTAVDNVHFTLLPQTKLTQASLHLDLSTEKLDIDRATSLINKFLSHLCFCSDQPLWLGNNGFSGSASKQVFPKEQLRPFKRRIDRFPSEFHLLNDKKKLVSLALYREGKIASLYSKAFACLSFYKIIEPLKAKNKKHKLASWMQPHLEDLEELDPRGIGRLKDEASRKNLTLDEYIFKHIRNNAAHLFLDSNVNLDDEQAAEIFYFATYPLEYMARSYIEQDLEVPTLLDWYKHPRN
ncbi:methylamine utilization protein MauJ [Thalassospira tepidiphila]|uniref:methylamine utilization protein MauJ n=1 Tax=Thalassospira tepidiphila TaxID=393657 RepID=UPI003AA9AC89